MSLLRICLAAETEKVGRLWHCPLGEMMDGRVEEVERRGRGGKEVEGVERKWRRCWGLGGEKKEEVEEGGMERKSGGDEEEVGMGWRGSREEGWSG